MLEGLRGLRASAVVGVDLKLLIGKVCSFRISHRTRWAVRLRLRTNVGQRSSRPDQFLSRAHQEIVKIESAMAGFS
jgi:hypothetical protein